MTEFDLRGHLASLPPPNPDWQWRTGRKNPFAIYGQTGLSPSDTDPPIGSLRSADLAQRAVDDHNRMMGLRIEAEELFRKALLYGDLAGAVLMEAGTGNDVTDLAIELAQVLELRLDVRAGR